jgi:8-hydroxy-5-deazaflavin:NADPH oxidoreductase
MNIAIIGTGNVGGALTKRFSAAGHRVFLGVRDISGFKGAGLETLPGVSIHLITEAVAAAAVVVVAAPAKAVIEVAESLGDLSNKVLIDTMNAVFMKPGGFNNTADALLAHTNCTDVVKCFNTTGFENMTDPDYHGTDIDMFMAGNSVKGKEIARKLAKDAGFAECYDFGGNDKFNLIEQFALSWINLAIMQQYGRNIAFKVIRR